MKSILIATRDGGHPAAPAWFECEKGGVKVLYTLEEVAQKIKVSKKTLYRWINSGKLKAHKVGRHWRVTEEDLQKILKGEEN